MKILAAVCIFVWHSEGTGFLSFESIAHLVSQDGFVGGDVDDPAHQAAGLRVVGDQRTLHRHGQLTVVGQGLQPILPADLIDQADDLLLVICNGGIYRGDVDYLPRIDQVEILNFGIGAFDLAQAHLVLRCDLPQRVFSRDGVGDGGTLEPQRPCLPLGAMS